MRVSNWDATPPLSSFEVESQIEEPVDAAERLHPCRLPRLGKTDSGKGLLPRSSSSALQRSGSDLGDTMKSVLKRTTSTISRSSSAGTKEFLTALEATVTGDYEEASAQVQSAASKFWQKGLVLFIARVLICLFFLDNCLAAYHNWQFYQNDFMKFKVKNYPHRYQDPGFPYFQLLVVVPCSILTMLGVSTRWTATFLVMDMMRDGTGIILEGVRGAIQHKMAVNEMAAKHLAMLGSSILILAHELRSQQLGSSVAGTLLGDRNKPPGKLRSAIMLVSRLFLTLLFITVGVTQALRVIERDWQWAVHSDYFRKDGHDNNFLLLEALLAIPFALGYKSKWITPVLAATLVAEACFCWSPLEHWPSVQYTSHVRAHFATNMGSAGGLILLCLSSGSFTMDKLLSKKRD